MGTTDRAVAAKSRSKLGVTLFGGVLVLALAAAFAACAGDDSDQPAACGGGGEATSATITTTGPTTGVTGVGGSGTAGAGGTNGTGGGTAGGKVDAGKADARADAPATGGSGGGGGVEGGTDARPANEAGPSLCGNGVVDPGEPCDDGNKLDGDGCSSICTDSHACEACEADNCPVDNTLNDSGDPSVQPACSAYTKMAAAGPARGTNRSQLCFSVYACTVRTRCAIDHGATYCYCGDITLAECQAGHAKGDCKAEIEAGLETTEAPAVLLNLTNVNLATGGALNRATCDHDNCGNPSLGGGMWQCLPPLGVTPDGGTGAGGSGNGSAGSAGTGGSGTVDAGPDVSGGGSGGSAIMDASAETNSTGTGGTSVVEAGGSDAPPAEICPADAGHSMPAICAACEESNCPHDPQGCSSGTCTRQPACGDYATAEDRALCQATLDCIRATNCIAGGQTSCYCGAGVSLATCQGGGGTGACKTQLEAGFKTTVPSIILMSFSKVDLPAGGAMSLGQCDHDNCGSPLLDGNNECVPYCK